MLGCLLTPITKIFLKRGVVGISPLIDDLRRRAARKAQGDDYGQRKNSNRELHWTVFFPAIYSIIMSPLARLPRQSPKIIR
jgi:hypothetical protein